MPSEDPAYPLHILTIFTFVPAFPLLLAHGIVSGEVVPAVGIVPLAGSAAFSAFLLYKEKRRESDDAPVLRPSIILAIDAFLAACIITVLIFTWLIVPGEWGRGNWVMLATYGTFPLLANLSIHTFEVFRAVAALLYRPTLDVCPHCNHSLRDSPKRTRRHGNSKTNYSLLVAEGGEYHDDEEGEASAASRSEAAARGSIV
ncbi:uncharacterized protein K441DRAFT_640011 [Cenococcum geophilum 1.58]|uniref:uncharacterized protein n=1 Tax=Cenococcum geophilum 1.58 TaxID=794803 RepID=UPI00358EED1F|nr:hypothetical protein K441DRAFT_640011 [Cenococcum geophilum 1.58]